MSGRPNSTEITALLMNFQRANQLADSIQRRTKVIDAEQTARAAEVMEHADLMEKSHKLIDGMDVRADGNYGFRGRYHWFLLELVRQAETSGRINP